MWNPGTWWLGLPAHSAFPWSFGPRNKPVPPNVTPVPLHLPCALGNTLNSLRGSCSFTAPRSGTTCADSPAQSSSHLMMFWVGSFCFFVCFVCFCVFACLLSVFCRQKAGWASAIRSPSIYSSSTTARQTWLSSLPPTCIGLLSSHLCKY